MTDIDPAIVNIRRELVAAAVERARVVVTYTYEDLECVVVGRLTKVSARHAVVAENLKHGTPVPIAAILKVERCDGSKAEELIESAPSNEVA